MHEDKPLILIPYYEINFKHFLTSHSPDAGESSYYWITSAAFNPSISIIAF